MRASLIVVTAIITTAACSSSTTPSTTGSSTSGSTTGACANTASTPNSTLTATIDGVQWRPPVVTARRGNASGDAYLEVDTYDAACTLFGFAVQPANAALTVGTYQVGSSPTNASYVTVGGGQRWTAAANVGSGTVTVTNFSTTNKTGAGTFSFVLVGASSSKTVTNGTFSVTFP